MNVTLALSSLSLVVGGLVIAQWVISRRRPALSVRLARAEGLVPANRTGILDTSGMQRPDWVEGLLARYERELRLTGEEKTLRQLAQEKLLAAVVVPCMPLLPPRAARARTCTPPPTPQRAR